MDQEKRRGRRALVVSTAAAVAAVLGTTGLAWGVSDVRRQATPSPEAVGEAFIAIEPVRVLDTRPPGNGPIGVPVAGPLTGGNQIDLPLTTAAPNAAAEPLPANATSVLINVTIDGDATEKSFLTVWPEGTPRPFASANNAEPGLVSPNLTFAKLGPTGGISIYAQAGSVNLAVDMVGYTVPLADAPGSGLLLTGAGPPSDDRGADGSFYLDTETGLLYGPKTDGAWPTVPAPGSSPEAVSQGIDDSAETLAAGTDPVAFDYGDPVTVWSVSGLTVPGDYELEASVAIRPDGTALAVDATVQCWWSTRPTRTFTQTLPLSLTFVDQDQVQGTVSVPGSIEAGTTADLVCQVGSVALLGGEIEIQSVQVNAQRVNLVDNS